MTNQIEPRRPVPSAPVHPLAALATIVLDNLFTLPEFMGPEMWIFTIPLVGGAGFLATTLVQRYLAKDEWGPSIAKGVVMGIIAGVPISVTGTAAGAVLLGWAGLHQWIKLPGLRSQGQLPADDQIIDADVKDVQD